MAFLSRKQKFVSIFFLPLPQSHDPTCVGTSFKESFTLFSWTVSVSSSSERTMPRHSSAATWPTWALA